MRNLLVTGGAGFIGSNFVHYWLGAHPGDGIVVLDSLAYSGNQANLKAAFEHSNFRFVRGDICTPGLAAALLREHAISIIVHFAAESHVDRSIKGPDAFVHTNIVGTHELLKAARQVWLEEGGGSESTRFHHISTDEVYGSLAPSAPPFTEDSAYAPNSPYAASKAAADHLVRAYHHTYRLPVTTTNCSNNYGPYQFPEKLIPLMLVNLLEGKPLPVYGDGLNVRDWLYVEDHCRAIDRVIAEGELGETYNVAGGNEWKNIDIVRLLCILVDEAFSRDRTLAGRFPRSPMAAGLPSEKLITFVKDRPGHDRRYALHTEKIERKLGFRPQESFESGIRKTLSWYLANEGWWRAVMDQSYREWVQTHYDQSADPAQHSHLHLH
jgi:dTDP-glucose 4,6-dehydratase